MKIFYNPALISIQMLLIFLSFETGLIADDNTASEIHFPRQCKNINFPKNFGSVIKLRVNPNTHPASLNAIQLTLAQKDAMTGLSLEEENYETFHWKDDFKKDRVKLDWVNGSYLGGFLPQLSWHSIELSGLLDWESTGEITLWLETFEKGEVSYSSYKYSCE